MKMEDIVKAIDRFIDSRMYRYALLINGEWGCGKTFFIQREVIPHLKKEINKDVNYVSLFGIQSVDEISQLLCVEAIKDKLGKPGAFLDSRSGQLAASILSGAARFGLSRIGADGTGLDEILALIPNYNNNVIIFDDLERCCCDISEVLGYINLFVEHSDAAVILVANEEEIGKWMIERNPELQMLIAMDKRIDVEVEPTEEERFESFFQEHYGKKPEPRETYSLGQIEQKRRTIFHNNNKYRRMKEKVVGQTINYEPNLKRIFNSIVDGKVSQPYLRKALEDIIDQLVGIAKEEKHCNIRTFQFFLEKAIIIFDSIQTQFTTISKEILLYTYRSSVRYMKGDEMPSWEGDYGNINISRPDLFAKQIMGFKFIDDLVSSNCFDEDYVRTVLAQFVRIAERKGQLADDPYRKINQWYLASDEELEKWLNEIERGIKEGKYSTELYTDLLNQISYLYACDIMRDQCNKIIESMKAYIIDADPRDIEYLEREHFANEGEAGAFYKKHRSVIDELIKDKKNQSEKKMYEDAIKSDIWGTKLLQMMTEKVISGGHSFIYWIDPQAIASKLFYSNNAELQQFRFAMQRYYEHTEASKKICDAEKLVQLKRILKDSNIDCLGQIHRYYYKLILGDIDRYLKEIEQAQLNDRS